MHATALNARARILPSLLVVMVVLVGASVPRATAAVRPPRRGRTRRAAAASGSLVYVKNNNVWIARADGSGARQVTSGNDWYLPSQSDDGVIVAETLGRMAADGTQGADLAVMDQSGHITNRVPTPSDFSTTSVPAYPPTQVRVSPDGTKIAYENFVNDENTTYWTPSDATSITERQSQPQGQEGAGQPTWIDNSHLLLERTSVFNCDPDNPLTLMRTYHVGDPDGSSINWFDESTNSLCGGWANQFAPTISRDGNKVAIIEDNALDYLDGKPTEVHLRLFTTAGNTSTAPTLACDITLSASAFSDYTARYASPTFLPDGSGLAWGDNSGIRFLDTSDLSPCPNASAATTLVSGAAEPFFSPAPLVTPVEIAGAGVAKRFTNKTSLPISWSGDGGPYDIRYRAATWDDGFSNYTTWQSDTSSTSAVMNGEPGTTYCFSGADHGVDQWGPERCTSIPLDDRALSGSWSRGNGAYFFEGTFSKTKQKGAKLTLTGAHAGTVAVLAQTCSTCGTLAVMWDGTKIGTINLHSAKKKTVFFTADAGSASDGDLVLKVTSKGKPVVVDGVALSPL